MENKENKPTVEAATVTADSNAKKEEHKDEPAKTEK